jgi:hypothetical protein
MWLTLTKVSRHNRWRVAACVLIFFASLIRYHERYDPTESYSDYPESVQVAHHLFKEGRFASPFAALDTGPSAHVAPVVPAIQALLMKVFGDQSSGMYAMRWLTVSVLSLQLALFPVVSKKLGMGSATGFIAAAVWIIAKLSVPYEWESVYAGLLLALACCCYRRHMETSAKAKANEWVLGGLIGLLVLTSPPTALIFLVWLAYDVYSSGAATFLKKAFVPLVLLPFLMVVPWTIRNYMLFHRVIPVRDNLGLELSVSNNDCAQVSIYQNLSSGCFDKFHPNHNRAEARKVRAMGEVNYNDLRLREAESWIASHPEAFVSLSAARFMAFWIPTQNGDVPETSGWRLQRGILYIYLMTAFSGTGLITLYRRDAKSAVVCVSCLVAFPVVYYFLQFEDRYRYPILWLTFLLGSLPIATCLGFKSASEPTRRCKVAPSLAAVPAPSQRIAAAAK